MGSKVVRFWLAFAVTPKTLAIQNGWYSPNPSDPHGLDDSSALDTEIAPIPGSTLEDLIEGEFEDEESDLDWAESDESDEESDDDYYEYYEGSEAD